MTQAVSSWSLRCLTVLGTLFTVAAHGATPVTVNPNGATYVSMTAASAYSGFAVVNINGVNMLSGKATGAAVSYQVRANVAGTYHLSSRYSSQDGDAKATLKLNNMIVGNSVFTRTTNQSIFADSATVPIALVAGLNTIQFVLQTDNLPVNIARLVLTPRSETTPPSTGLQPILAAPSDEKWSLTFDGDLKRATLNDAKWGRSSPQGFLDPSMGVPFFDPWGGIITNTTTGLILRALRNGSGYKSGGVHTSGRFSQAYGYFEIKLKTPKGTGFWPAFWLMPEHGLGKYPEVDIFEMVTKDASYSTTNFHRLNSAGSKVSWSGSYRHPAPLSDAFHIFGMRWKPGQMTFYIDGIQRYQYNGADVPNMAMHMLLDLGVGGGWGGLPSSATPFPADFMIEHVRVFQYEGAPVAIHPAGMVIRSPSANLVRVARGQQITFNFEIEAYKPAANYQVVLEMNNSANALLNFGGKINGVNLVVGRNKLQKVVTIPADLPPGDYIMGVAVYDANAGWKNVTQQSSLIAFKVY